MDCTTHTTTVQLRQREYTGTTFSFRSNDDGTFYGSVTRWDDAEQKSVTVVERDFSLEEWQDFLAPTIETMCATCSHWQKPDDYTPEKNHGTCRALPLRVGTSGNDSCGMWQESLGRA